MKNCCPCGVQLLSLCLILTAASLDLSRIVVLADDKPLEQVSKTGDQLDGEVPALERDDEYYELLRLFADTLDQVDRNYVKNISRRELMEAAIQGMLSKLDEYSNYIAPDDVDRFKGSVESEFGGIGIQVSTRDGQLMVISPIVGSPAYEAGLMAGDTIIEIEGKSTKGITLDEAVRRMKGKVGTEVTIKIVHVDDPMPKEVTLKRAIVRVNTVLGERRKDDDSWNYFYDDQQKLAYIRVTAFSRHTADELRIAINELLEQDMQGLILDLRFNPGGLLSSAIEVCDMFIKRGRIVSTEGRNTPQRTWDAHRRGTFPDFPLVVLVNGYSASASEIVSACLQDHQRAVIIGERTFGKGSVQNIIELEGGKSALKLTTAGYQRPSGKNIHRDDEAEDDEEWGVRPNEGFEVKLSRREIGNLIRHQYDQNIIRKPPSESSDEEPQFEDRQFNKALEYLVEKLSVAQVDAAKAETNDALKVDPVN